MSTTFSLILTSGIALHLSVGAMAAGNAPTPLLFDTDIGKDIDDALALGMIHAFISRGECDLKAVTLTNDHSLAASFVDAVNTFYGRGDTPIGVIHNCPAPESSRYAGLVNTRDGDRMRYPHKLLRTADAPDAVTLLRRSLAAAEDGTVVVVQVGASTNLARLLRSPADETCQLAGVNLVRKKVRLLSIMAGTFEGAGDQPQPEYNVKIDVGSAQSVVTGWPTPIVFSGFEVGMAIEFPGESIERDFTYAVHHPLAEAYNLHTPSFQGRPSWDLTSVLYAVRPNCGYFDLSPPGRVRVADDGTTTFKPDKAGLHRYLVFKSEQRDRVREALTNLVSQPPTFAYPCR